MYYFNNYIIIINKKKFSLLFYSDWLIIYNISLSIVFTPEGGQLFIIKRLIWQNSLKINNLRFDRVGDEGGGSLRGANFLKKIRFETAIFCLVEEAFATLHSCAFESSSIACRTPHLVAWAPARRHGSSLHRKSFSWISTAFANDDIRNRYGVSHAVWLFSRPKQQSRLLPLHPPLYFFRHWKNFLKKIPQFLFIFFPHPIIFKFLIKLFTTDGKLIK